MKINYPLLFILLSSCSALPHDDDMVHDMQGSVTSAHANPHAALASPIPTMSMSMPPSPVSMHGGHHHGNSILDDPDLEPQQKAYWQQYNTTNFLNETTSNASKSLLISHIVVTFIAWVFLYPISVTISGQENSSNAYLIIQTFQSIVALIGLFCLALYSSNAPSLYPNNAYSKMSIILFFIITIHWSSMMIKQLAKYALNTANPIDGTEYMLANINNSGTNRPSHDSGHGSGSDGITSPTINSSDNFHPDVDATGYDLDVEEDEDLILNIESKPMFEIQLKEKLFSRIFNKYPIIKSTVSKLETSASIIYTLINKPLFLYSFAYLLTGIATFYRLGMANRVFSLLAHFIKGGVFFLFGILTLGRYCGTFANHGMAWNIRPGSDLDISSKKKSRVVDNYSSSPFHKPLFNRTNIVSRVLQSIVNRIPSMEFIECFLIFFYGSTNIFLERLANPHGAWAHKDLQHVSIAFMYIGGGLCGLIVESPSIRKLLFNATHKEEEDEQNDSTKARYYYSFNPIAAFTIFWTGVLMSQHQQETPLATQIHAQWGTLLSVAAIFRLFTYFMLYLAPPASTKPTQPFTELIVSFCLICGGMVFIESNGETVEAMMYYGLDSMFSLNVNVGFAVLIMSWVMIVLTIKGWISRR